MRGDADIIYMLPDEYNAALEINTIIYMLPDEYNAALEIIYMLPDLWLNYSKIFFISLRPVTYFLYIID
jgi:hypothetical protein